MSFRGLASRAAAPRRALTPGRSRAGVPGRFLYYRLTDRSLRS